MTVDAGPTGKGTVRIAPIEPTAMSLAITGGRDEISCVEFGDVAAIECLGNRRTVGGLAILPAEELGLLLRAVVTGGAELCTAPVRGRLLHLGDPPAPVGGGQGARRRRPLQSWAPIAPSLGPMMTILRPLEQDSPRPDLFTVPAFRLSPGRPRIRLGRAVATEQPQSA
ncbi:hypothetical protein ACEXQD_06940 [Herbiconiux sp. P15]|uniref:hypothetical protein n=1 Tax=Herbiconiux liukaitaii TaxID=3342799 RepID=UPI0035B8FBAA